MDGNPFTEGEIARRLGAVRAEIAARNLEAAIFASPENVFYLTGLDHWGYFAPHLLIVPLEGRPILITRAMERVTIENHVRAADFRGHPDSETAADLAARILADLGFTGRRLGLEFWTSGLSHGLATRLATLTYAEWSDVSNLVDQLRLVKSAEEQALMRRAAAITDVATAAAIEAIADGVPERNVAAECIAAMTRSGGMSQASVLSFARLPDLVKNTRPGAVGTIAMVILSSSNCPPASLATMHLSAVWCGLRRQRRGRKDGRSHSEGVQCGAKRLEAWCACPRCLWSMARRCG